jgi:dihydrodipicolinate synthase/N-acetylneuraminate lyase
VARPRRRTRADADAAYGVTTLATRTPVDQPAIRGSLPALVTPLTAGGAVHDDDLAGLVHRALADGASGVLVAGSTGEGTLLDPDQRARTTRVARQALDNLRAPRPLLVAGASGPTVRALQEDVARLAEAGTDVVLVLAPHTYPLAPEELGDLHLEVAEDAAIPTLLYHIPQLTGSALTPEVLPSLASHTRIVGMKDSSPDAARRRAFCDATSDLPAFDVLTGHAPTLRVALLAGASGSITAIANIRQRQVVALHAAVEAGNDPEAVRLQASLAALSVALGELGASTPATLKAILQLEGVISERWCRPPLRSIPPARLDHVRSALLRHR